MHIRNYTSATAGRWGAGKNHLLAGLIAAATLCPALGWALPVPSGNDLALAFSTAEEADRPEIEKEALNRLYFFRYLRIAELEKGEEAGGAPYIRMQTVEPSSDMLVEFTVRKSVSLRKAQPLTEGDCVAVTGRVQELEAGENRIRLDPVIVRYKDRPAPTRGQERLYEIDPDARKGSDTSTGKEIIVDD